MGLSTLSAGKKVAELNPATFAFVVSLVAYYDLCRARTFARLRSQIARAVNNSGEVVGQFENKVLVQFEIRRRRSPISAQTADRARRE